MRAATKMGSQLVRIHRLVEVWGGRSADCDSSQRSMRSICSLTLFAPRTPLQAWHPQEEHLLVEGHMKYGGRWLTEMHKLLPWREVPDVNRHVRKGGKVLCGTHFSCAVTLREVG